MSTKHILFLFVIQIYASYGVQITVEQGTLEGEEMELVTGEGTYYSFKGIPYAEPPVGTLRFKAPQPPASWEGVRNATQHGSVCPQVDIITNVFINGSEDCLFLNVYSPNLTADPLLPVLVFIHGGGYKSGSGNVDSYGPDFLIRKNMTVVTFNYRLDALGFLCLGTEEVPGNAGLKDQVLALKWVKANIKYFGGDPDRVTIMGQSAGSASVALHIGSPMSQGLFQRAISMSGVPFCDWSLPFHPERRAFALGRQLGFDTEDPDTLLGLLQNVTAEKLVNVTTNVFSFEEYTYNTLKMYQFVPVVERYCNDNNFLTYNIFEKFAHVNKADIMFGYTSEEAITDIASITSIFIKEYHKFPELFVPRKTLNQFAPSPIIHFSDTIRRHYLGNKTTDVNSNKEFVSYVSDVAFVYDIIKYYSELPLIENTTRYFYQFSSMSNRNVYGLQGVPYGIHGAGHIDDLCYVFDPKSMNLTLNSTELELVNQITTLFTDFAKYGDPNNGSTYNVTWPQFEKETLQYMDIGNNLTVSNALDHDNYNFWGEFYCSIGEYISYPEYHKLTSCDCNSN